MEFALRTLSHVLLMLFLALAVPMAMLVACVAVGHELIAERSWVRAATSRLAKRGYPHGRLAVLPSRMNYTR